MGEFGTSLLYIAKDDELPVQRKSWRGPPQIERTLLIKATTATSKDDIRRAETEVKLLRKLRHHPNILKLIDSGFSTLDDEDDYPIEKKTESSREISVSTKRLYCMLFEPCPDLPLWDLIAKQRRKQKQSKPRGFLRSFSRKSVLEEPGYFHISTVLDMFLQMCEGIKAMHNQNCTVWLHMSIVHFSPLVTGWVYEREIDLVWHLNVKCQTASIPPVVVYS